MPDNWWHSKDYVNVPLDTFMKILKKGLAASFTMSIGGDISEPGKNAEKKVHMIPTFDIPAATHRRQRPAVPLRQRDDDRRPRHHLIGYKEDGGRLWFLAKDSGSSAFNFDPKGY